MKNRERHGAWAHPPKKRPYLERHSRKWLAATFIFIVVSIAASFAMSAIEKAAYDAVNFDQFNG